MGETTIRLATTADAPRIAEIYAPIVRDTFISFETEPPGADEMARRIAATLPTHPWLVADAGEAGIIGYAYGSRHQDRAAYRWSANVTVYLAEAVRAKGLGRRLYGVLIDLLRRQGFRSLFAGVALPNPASVGLHEAMGFAPLGVYREVGFKLVAWRDVGWWRLGLSDAAGPAAEPTPLAELAAALPQRLG